MAGRQSQAAINKQTRQSVMLAAGGVLVIIGVLLLVGAFLQDTSGQLTSTPAPTEPIATTVPGSTVPPVEPRSFTVAATGDLLPQEPVNDRAAAIGSYWDAPYDFRPMFDAVRPRLTAADLALCHMETPIGAPGDPVRTGGGFNAPSELRWAITHAGYDGCSTASNHTFDMGEEGVRVTLEQFDAEQLGHAGSARTAEERARTQIYTVGDVKVGHLAYTYGLNGARLPPGREYLVNLIDPERIGADARAAREAGANVVIVSLHWGEEFEHEPTEQQVLVAQRLSAMPEISLVIGHHAHVVQPITKVGDLVVAYGLGNLLSNQHETTCCPAASQDGVIVEFTFEETPPSTGQFTVVDVAYTATRVDRETFTIVPIDDALADPDLDDTTREELETSRERTNAAIGLLGLLAHPDGP